MTLQLKHHQGLHLLQRKVAKAQLPAVKTLQKVSYFFPSVFSKMYSLHMAPLIFREAQEKFGG
jgi:hypothetical protein